MHVHQAKMSLFVIHWQPIQVQALKLQNNFHTGDMTIVIPVFSPLSFPNHFWHNIPFGKWFSRISIVTIWHVCTYLHRSTTGTSPFDPGYTTWIIRYGLAVWCWRFGRLSNYTRRNTTQKPEVWVSKSEESVEGCLLAVRQQHNVMIILLACGCTRFESCVVAVNFSSTCYPFPYLKLLKSSDIATLTR